MSKGFGKIFKYTYINSDSSYVNGKLFTPGQEIFLDVRDKGLDKFPHLFKVEKVKKNINTGVKNEDIKHNTGGKKNVREEVKVGNKKNKGNVVKVTESECGVKFEE